jgi:hypothetical protein
LYSAYVIDQASTGYGECPRKHLVVRRSSAGVQASEDSDERLLRDVVCYVSAVRHPARVTRDIVADGHVQRGEEGFPCFRVPGLGSVKGV